MNGSVPLTSRQARDLAGRVLGSPHGRPADACLRPRGVFGLWRSRPPLWVVLLLADRDGQLLRDGDQFALREPPLADRSSGRTWLRQVDRYWDVLCFAVPPGVLLVVAAAVVPLSSPGPVRRVLALAVVALALLWVAVLLLAVLLRQVYLLVPRRPVEMATGQLRTLNATLTVLHAATADGATGLVGRALAAGPGPLVVLTDGITGSTPDRRGPRGLRVEPLPGLPALVARRAVDPPPRAPTTRGDLRGRDAALVLVASATMVAVVAKWVAEAEREACGLDCEGHPTSYGDAVYWLVSRLLGGDPDGLGAVSALGRSVGVLMTLFGVYVLVFIVGSVVRRRMDDDLRSAADVVAAYEAQRSATTGRPVRRRPGRRPGRGSTRLGRPPGEP